jgi:hypothetical protein
VGTLVSAPNRKTILEVFRTGEKLPAARPLRASPVIAIFLA